MYNTKNVFNNMPCSCGRNDIRQTSRPLIIKVKEHKRKLKKREVLNLFESFESVAFYDLPVGLAAI